MNDNAMHHRLIRLLQQHRWAALATADLNGTPMASMVGYVPGDNAAGIYLHLSRLAVHTGNLLGNGNAALVVSEEDTAVEDPQELARVTLQGSCVVIACDSEEYTTAKALYLHRLPASERLFDFPDFILFRMDVASARFVGGFAQARSFTGDELRRLSVRVD